MDEKKLKISFFDKIKLNRIKKQRDKLIEKYGENVVNDFMNETKSLPEPKKKDDFLEKYKLTQTESVKPKEKEESPGLVYQSTYCQIDDETYKLPLEFTMWILDQREHGNDINYVKDSPNGKDHFLLLNQLTDQEKYEVYGKIINITLDTIEKVLQLIDNKQNMTEHEMADQAMKKNLLNRLIVESNFNNFFTGQRYEEGNLDEALESQENVTREALGFYTNIMSENNKNNMRTDTDDRAI